jgi:hypothetical protein
MLLQPTPPLADFFLPPSQLFGPPQRALGFKHLRQLVELHLDRGSACFFQNEIVHELPTGSELCGLVFLHGFLSAQSVTPDREVNMLPLQAHGGNTVFGAPVSVFADLEPARLRTCRAVGLAVAGGAFARFFMLSNERSDLPGKCPHVNAGSAHAENGGDKLFVGQGRSAFLAQFLAPATVLACL